MDIKVRLSDQARREYAERTGQVLASTVQLTPPLADMTEAQRARLLGVLPSLDNPSLEQVTGQWGRTLGQEVENIFSAFLVPETPVDWMALVYGFESQRQAKIADEARIAAERATKQAAALAKCDADLERVEGMTDAELLIRRRELHYLVELPYGRSADQQSRRNALVARAEAIEQAIADKKESAERAERQRQDAHRAAWIMGHGSEFLRKAVDAGYNCQRRYVTERAALEHPGYVVDFDDAATWRSRSCPSESALIVALADGGTVVWLTRPVTVPGDDYGEVEPLEAVVITAYLERYTLVRA